MNGTRDGDKANDEPPPSRKRRRRPAWWNWKIAIRAGAVIVFALAGFLVWRRFPTIVRPQVDEGLVDALKRDRARLNFTTLSFFTPFDTGTKLGFRPKGNWAPGESLATESAPCFAVQPDESLGSTLEVHKYRSRRKLEAEFGAVKFEKAAARLQQDGELELRLTHQRFRKGLGAPIPTGPCTFLEGPDANREVVVDSELLSDTDFFASATEKGDLSHKSKGDDVDIDGESAGRALQRARDLVLAGNLAAVKVEVILKEAHLGRHVEPQSIDLSTTFSGSGIDGVVSVVAFAGARGVVSLIVTSSPGVKVDRPQGFEALGEPVEVPMSQPKDFKMSRNVTLRILPDYVRPGSVETSDKLLKLRAYVTKYAPGPTTSAAPSS